MNGALAAMLLPVSVRVLGALNCTEVEFVERAESFRASQRLERDFSVEGWQWRGRAPPGKRAEEVESASRPPASASLGTLRWAAELSGPVWASCKLREELQPRALVPAVQSPVNIKTKATTISHAIWRGRKPGSSGFGFGSSPPWWWWEHLTSREAGRARGVVSWGGPVGGRGLRRRGGALARPGAEAAAAAEYPAAADAPRARAHPCSSSRCLFSAPGVRTGPRTAGRVASRTPDPDGRCAEEPRGPAHTEVVSVTVGRWRRSRSARGRCEGHEAGRPGRPVRPGRPGRGFPGGGREGRRGEGRSANSGPRRRHPVYGPAACAPTAPCAGTARSRDSAGVAEGRGWRPTWSARAGGLSGFWDCVGRVRELRTAACWKAA
ncbi:hypothetical protein NN561_013677 [Cricetulus griseus]